MLEEDRNFLAKAIILSGLLANPENDYQTAKDAAIHADVLLDQLLNNE